MIKGHPSKSLKGERGNKRRAEISPRLYQYYGPGYFDKAIQEFNSGTGRQAIVLAYYLYLNLPPGHRSRNAYGKPRAGSDLNLCYIRWQVYVYDFRRRGE